MTVQIPWGQLLLGKRPIVWGTGLRWNGAENRTFEHLIWRLFYGPFTGMIGWTPYMLGTTNQSYYNQDFDNNNIRIWNTMTGLHYRTGRIDSGVMWGHHAWHTGGEGLLTTSATRNTSGYADYEGNTGGIYFKYNNGQLFFNSEVDWYYVITQKPQTYCRRRSCSRFVEPISSTLAMDALIGGMLSGPSKMSLLYAWLAGPDRRGGQQIDQTGLKTDVGIRGNLFSNTGFFRPYSYLMVYSYGLGTHMNADTLNGTAEDASIWAARVDYAVASNLNIFGSFFWANRTSQSGYGWGFHQT